MVSEFVPTTNQTNHEEVPKNKVFFMLSHMVYLEVERINDGRIKTTFMPHHYPWRDEVRRFESIVCSPELWETTVRVMDEAHRARIGTSIYGNDRVLEVLSDYKQYRETMSQYGVADTDLFNPGMELEHIYRNVVILGEQIKDQIRARYVLEREVGDEERPCLVKIELCDTTNGHDVDERKEYAYTYQVEPGQVFQLIQDWRMMNVSIVHSWVKAEEEQKQEFEDQKLQALQASQNMILAKGYMALPDGATT